MMVFDLKEILFGFCLLLFVVVWLTIRLERRKQHKRHHLNQTDMWQVLERVPFGWLILDSSNTYCYANSYARRVLGLTASAGQLPEEDWAFILDDERAQARREASAVGRYREVQLPSDKIVRWWISPEGNLDFVYLLDITTHKQAEEATRYLFSGMSHELRTPLGVILTHLEIMQSATISDEIKAQSLHLTKAEAKRMARLVNLMLELGRLETSPELEMRPVDLTELVEQAIECSADAAQERGISFSLQVVTPLPMAFGDADRLMRVFLNLLDNVIKHCRKGDRAIISLAPSADGITCVVQDSGPGIPPEHLPHITRRFYRAAPEEVEGSGLGLAMVAEILRRHGSHLNIESCTEGEETGTKISFILPTLPKEA